MTSSDRWIVGVDVGGTFTDLCALNERDGRFVRHKRPSTPGDPSEAVLSGVMELCAQSDIDPAQIVRVSHGTTVATNALIEKRGGRVALIVTEGFRDLLEIGRQTRPKIYDLQVDHPAPLVPRELRFEAAERITAGGRILRNLQTEEINRLVEVVRAADVDACAVCLLFAFVNPAHESALAGALQAAIPGLYVSISSQVRPEFREYERLSTTVLNAYLQPVMSRYLQRLEINVADVAPKALLGINQSSGGLISAERARRFPIRTALSGPAAGVAGTIDVALRSGMPNLITLDIGGTSSDIAVIRDARAVHIQERWIEGYPARVPSIDINAVGAGGGSIAWLDSDGLLKVGPHSAGARPGPACYGHGGDRPTVSDANLIAGRLSARGLLNGAMPMQRGAAEKVIGDLADKLALSPERTALGIIAIAVANMVRGIRSVSIERGYNPAEFSLFAFGGAGPLHAVDVAHNLGMRRVVVPLHPGLLCAQGLLVADHREDFVRSAAIPLNADAAEILRQAHAELVVTAEDWFRAEDIAPAKRQLEVGLDMRYVGQNFEINVRIGSPDELGDAQHLRDLFHDAHAMTYGFANPEAPVESVNLRLAAIGRSAGMPAAELPVQQTPVPFDRRPIWFNAERAVETPVYDRAILRPGHAIVGPAVIEQLDSTSLVYPGDCALVDDHLNLIIDLTT